MSVTEPSFAYVAGTMMANAFDMLDTLEAESSTTLNARAETMRNAIQGARAQGLTDWTQRYVNSYAGPLSESFGREAVNILLAQFAEAIDKPTKVTDLAQLFEDLYDYMITNNQWLHSRGFTFGTPSAGGGNTGSGEVIRLTVDESTTAARTIVTEGWFPDAFTLTCKKDARALGTVGQEVFLLEGTNEHPDGSEFTGSGIADEVISVDSRTSAEYLQNASFDSATSAAVLTTPAVPTALPGWTVAGSLSNLQIDLDLPYIRTPGASADQALRFVANETISQDLVNIVGASFDQDVPYAIGFGMYRESLATGTLTSRLASGLTGGVSRSITIGSESNASYTWFWLVSSPGADNWPANFNVNDLTLSFKLESLAVGEILIDHIIVAPFTRVGSLDSGRDGRGSMGTWMLIRSGTTPWVKTDVYTFTDTEDATRRTNQYWFARSGRGYLPAVADATQVTAAGGRTLTFADANPDMCTASSGDFVADGYVPGMILTVAGTSNNNGTAFVLSAVSALVLTTTGVFVAEGPLSATATLDATAPIVDK